MSIGGSSIGVFHVTTEDGAPPSDAVQANVEVVARRASERLAMLRAFEVSQTQANSDSLTGLMTRRSLEAAVRELRATGTQYSLAYGDLDHFKNLNDSFGHAAGDRALRTFSQVLRDSLRPADIPGRYGGEEFVIVLPDCPLEEAHQVLERVRERLADRITIAAVPTFTVSFGLAASDQARRLRPCRLTGRRRAPQCQGCGARPDRGLGWSRSARREPRRRQRPIGAAAPHQRWRPDRGRTSRASAQLRPNVLRTFAPAAGRSRGLSRSRLTTLALPNGMTAWLEIENPSPLASVHFMPAVDEAHVKGPSVIDWP